MSPGTAERDAEVVDELEQLSSPVYQESGRFGEALAATGADLHLGRDQLADEMRLQHRADRGGLELLEATDEPEADGVEQGELLLDGEREIAAGFEGVARAREHLLPRKRLSFPH